MVEIFYEDTEILDLDPEFFVSWLGRICQQKKHNLGDINIIFCSDDYLLKMNIEHLDHDYYTDIITFDYTDGATVSGDLFISIERVAENAKTFKSNVSRETNRVVVHGVLHLLGFGDKTEEEKLVMHQEENLALDLIVPRGT